MSIRSFLDKVEEIVLKGLDEGQEVVEEAVDNVKERWVEFQEDIKSVPSFRECLATRMRLNNIKDQSKGRRHKSQKQLRR
jgi:hypothetical protein